MMRAEAMLLHAQFDRLPTRLRQPAGVALLHLLLMVSPLATGCVTSGNHRAAIGPTAPSATVPAEADLLAEMQPDRPDLTNGTHIVPQGLLQVEVGGAWSRVGPGLRSIGTPLAIRVGLNEWLEGRIETAGIYVWSGPERVITTFGGVQLGMKLGLPGRLSFVAFLPSVNLPVGNAVGTDAGVRLLAGTDLGARSHVDANYGLASIGSAGPRFLQHFLSASVSCALGDHASPYVELYGFSGCRREVGASSRPMPVCFTP